MDPAPTEFADIREQLKEISALAQEEVQLSNKYGGQLSTLKQDLAMAEKQIEFERERRLDLERTLESERREQLPDEHIETIKRREEDIRTVREEKAAMLEWLQRGVDEAQRITLQIEGLKTASDQAKTNENEFLDDTRRLKEMEERLSSEINETKARIKQLTDQRDSLQEHSEQQASVLGVTTDIAKSTEADVGRLQADVEKLQDRARDVETIEIAMGCMAASVRRTVHELEQMQQAVNTGTFPPDDGYDSGQDADDTTFSPVVLSSTKAKIGRCDALLSTLWSSMKRFDQDSGTRNATTTAKHNALVQSLQKEMEETRKSTEAELSAMRADADLREPQLRRFIHMREEAAQKYEDEVLVPPRDDVSTSEGVGPMMGGGSNYRPFDLIHYIETETDRLREDNAKLIADNKNLAKRVDNQQEDYAAVKALKRDYRDLEAQRTILSHAIRTAEVNNKEMKFYLFEQKQQQGVSGGRRGKSGSGTPRGGSTSQQRPPWRSPTLETSY